MTDPYRTPAEIAADIPRDPFLFWFPFAVGAAAMGLAVIVGWAIVETYRIEHGYPPAMHDVPPRTARAPEPLIDNATSQWGAHFPGETITLFCARCEGDLCVGGVGPAGACDGDAIIQHLPTTKAKAPPTP